MSFIMIRIVTYVATLIALTNARLRTVDLCQWSGYCKDGNSGCKNVIKYVKHATEELPLTVGPIQQEFIRMINLVARNVTRNVKHEMEEAPQIVRFVKQDYIRMTIMPLDMS